MVAPGAAARGEEVQFNEERLIHVGQSASKPAVNGLSPAAGDWYDTATPPYDSAFAPSRATVRLWVARFSDLIAHAIGIVERIDGQKIARGATVIATEALRGVRVVYTSIGEADCEFAGDANPDVAPDAVSIMTRMASLLKDVELTPGQLAELRAIDALYYSRLANSSASSSASMASLDDLVLARVRDMLRDDQRALFDRNRAARHSDEAHDGAHIERRS